jgi:hypothetical protein
MKQEVIFTPWRSIRDGLVEATGSTSSYAESLATPCLTCSTAPCCTHLPIHTFHVGTLGDLNYAGYLLNFAHIRLGIGPSGEWSVYYAYPCRFLDQSSFSCSLHDTPEQPRVCVNYNPFGCWYRKGFTSADSAEIVLVDRARFSALTTILRFDEHQILVDAPDFDSVRRALAGVVDGPMPDTDPARTIPQQDATFDGWVADGQRDRGAEVLTGDIGVINAAETGAHAPCDGCSAPCCDTLVFPHDVPTGATGLDWFRFCLGFPGIELSIGPMHWSLVVKSPCQHLRNGRCAVYGLPERPLQCRYFDEWKCSFRIEFGRERPPSTFRIRLEHYDALLSCFDLDGSGSVVAVSTYEDMRSHVEAHIRSGSVVANTVVRNELMAVSN